MTTSDPQEKQCANTYGACGILGRLSRGALTMAGWCVLRCPRSHSGGCLGAVLST
jgi:hypothetical protein